MRLVLVLAVSLIAVATCHGEEKTEQKPWYSRWFGAGKTASKEPVKEAKEEKPAPDPAKLRAEAETAYHRRMAVCYKLQGIALATSDDDLNRKAEQLERRNWEIYLKRTAHLPTATTSRSDEREIEGNLGSPRRRGAVALPMENARATASLPAGFEDSARGTGARE